MNADHARLNAAAHHRARQHLPALIPHPHYVAWRNAARLRIERMERNWLAPGNRILLAQTGKVELAMQAVRRMRREHLQLLRLGVAMPLIRLQPCRMRRAVGIAKACNALRVDFDFTARRFQRVRLRIATEIGITHEARVLLTLRHLNQLVRLPELRKRRQRHLLARPTLACDGVEGLQPLQIALPFGKALAPARFPTLA